MRISYIFILIFSVILFSTLASTETVSAKKDTGMPEQVINLTATAISTSEIDLSWTEPADGGSPITGYQIGRKLQTDSWIVIVSDTGNINTDYSDSGLDFDSKYTYRVSAINDVGIGRVSHIASATTLEPANTVPDAPSGLTSTAETSLVSLSWDKPYDGGSKITDYRVEYSADNGNTWLLFDDGKNPSRHADITDLNSNTVYLFKVFAINNVGTSFASTPLEVVTKTIETRKSGGDDFVGYPPEFLGIGFYKIIFSSDADTSIQPSNGNFVESNQTRFGDYFPYSYHSDITDVENYGEIGSYEKHGQYFFVDGYSTGIPTIFGEVNQPIQIQVRLENRDDITEIQHVGMYANFHDTKNPKIHSNAFLFYDKYQTDQVFDKTGFFKDVKISTSIEDGFFWTIFDLTFEKPMENSDIMLEAWNLDRLVDYAVIPNALQILDPNQKITTEKQEVTYTTQVDITHDSSSPTCKQENSCYSPAEAKVLEGGVVTWINTDSFIHTVTSGTPEDGSDNKFNGMLMPGESFQFNFDTSGIYRYYCAIHPWAVGLVNVYEGDKPSVEEIPLIHELIIKSKTYEGSVLVENNDFVISPDHTFKFEISGHVEGEMKKTAVELTITKPDGSTEKVRTLTNERGYYSIPIILDGQNGSYGITAKYSGGIIGSVSFFIVN